MKTVNVLRMCGHQEDVQIVDDGRDTLRIARKARKQCSACAVSGNVNHGKKIKKGQEPKHAPEGTQIVLTKQDDGAWSGAILFDGQQILDRSPGLMGLTSKLCRKLLSALGKKVTGRLDTIASSISQPQCPPTPPAQEPR